MIDKLSKYTILSSIKTCFIGHHDICIENVKKKLKAKIVEQIKSGCVEFFVGNHGDFDNLVINTLLLLKSLYSHIQINLILTSLSSKNK